MIAIDLEQGLEDAWTRIATFVPKLAGFLIILLIGYIVAKVLSRVLDGILERIGFDNWVERGALKTTFERSTYDPSDILAVIVFWAVFLIALQLAFGVFGPNPVSDLLQGLISYLPNVLVAVIILVIAAALAKVVTELLTATLGAVSGGEWIARVAGIAILVLGIFAALNQLRVAPEIVNGLFYAILLVIAGSLVVAFGVGGIPIARRYLEQWSMRADIKAREIRQSADPEAGKQAVMDKLAEERARMEGDEPTGVRATE
jgi:Conserved TM helix